MQTMRRVFFVPGGHLRPALIVWPIAIALCLGAPASSSAQDAAQAPEVAAPAAPVIPQQVRYTGKLAGRAGDTVEADFRIFAAQRGGEPLWTETQQIAVGEDGSFTVLLGSATIAGLPQAVFAGGAARWLGFSVERGPESERALLSSVPYAMKSADAESLAGHTAADFVTQQQFSSLAAQVRQAAASAAEIAPMTSGTVTGSGATGTVPLWTGANTQGNSVITQLGTSVGIDVAMPTTTLAVGGTELVTGQATFQSGILSDHAIQMPAPAATATAPGYSANFEIGASSFNSSTASAVPQRFAFTAAPTGSNTAAPSAALQLRFGSGTTNPAPTGLSIAANGKITFAPSQTFPGTIAGVAATSPVTATTTSGAVTLGLNQSALVTAIAPSIATAITPTLESTFSGVYARLGAANTFTKPIVFAPTQTFPGAGTLTGITTSSPLTGSGTTGSVAVGLNQAALVTAISPAMTTAITPALETTFNTMYPQLAAQNTFTAGQILEGATSIGTANPSSGAMLTVTDSAGTFPATISASNGGNAGVGISAVAGTNGVGMKGIGTQTSESIGVFGTLAASNGPSGSYLSLFVDDDFNVGVWADAPDNSNVPNSAALVATADNLSSGIFYNDSQSSPTIDVLNNYSGGPTGNVLPAIGSVLRASGPGGMCGINQAGNISCTGQVKAILPTKDGTRQVETYSVQSAENWVEDYGSGQLSKGGATVIVEPAFAETVNTGVEYHVFLTPGGDCKGLYVTNKTPGSFQVRELGGGTSNIAFDYKIVAKRSGLEGQRLVDVTERMRMESPKETFKPLPQPLPQNRSPRPRPAGAVEKRSPAVGR